MPLGATFRSLITEKLKLPTKSTNFTSSGYIIANPAVSFNTYLCAFSVWCKVAGAGDTQFFRHNDATIGVSLALSVVSGALTITYRGGSATYSELPTSSWSHYLVYYDYNNGTSGDRIKVYKDGVLLVADTFSTPSNASAIGSPANMRYGSGSSVNATLYQPTLFSGVLPAVSSVYNTVTSKPKEVRTLPGVVSSIDHISTTSDSKGVSWATSGTVALNSSIPQNP